MTNPIVTTLSGNIVAIDLNTRDFEGFRADALELASSVAPDWTDRSELDPGVTLVECLAFMLDNLSYYQDRCANECLWSSITQRRSIIEQSRQIGYELSPNVSAQVSLTIVTTGAGTVPSGTVVSVDTSDGSDPASFELESDLVSTGAGTYTDIYALHGTTVSETLGSSTGLAGQSFELGSTPLANNPDGTSSLHVYVTEGGPAVEWTEVDNFLSSGSSDKHYTVEIDEYDVITVAFGDGVNGKIPALGTSNITATYRIGGGSTGNQVAANKLTKIGGSYPFVSSVTNPSAPNGGQDKETIEHAKEYAPASLKSLDRAVSHQDYETQALKVSGVSQAHALRGDGAYEERLIISSASTSNPVPSGSWDPYSETGTGLLGSVGAYVNERKATPVILLVEPCKVFDIYLEMEVYLFPTVRRSDVTRLIEDAIDEAFSVGSLELGAQIPISKVYDIVEDISGVDYLDIARFQRQPYARLKTEASVSDITFTEITVGRDTVKESWYVKFLSSTNFLVEGMLGSGLQVNTGTIGTTYTTDDGDFSFKIVAGITPPSKDDTWELVTGPYVGNMDSAYDELGRLYGNTFQLTLIGGQG